MPTFSVTLHCFPSSDVEFRRTAEALLRATAESAGLPYDPQGEFEARLRTQYPDAQVRARDPLAGLGSDVVWYVYRDSNDRPRRRRILVVEDDRSLALMIAAAMTSEGAEVRTAVDGEAALDLTQAWEPDVIVLDLGLPELDGRGFANRYRGRRASVPIVVVSGATDAVATSQQIGARACLPKPFELDELIELLRREAPQMEVSQA